MQQSEGNSQVHYNEGKKNGIDSYQIQELVSQNHHFYYFIKDFN